MSEQTKNLLGGNYNPDVLECLANLSNDEVFTPPKVVNQMLDMLPPETWSNPNLKFLDPACKTGVFLREIAKRLIVGLEEQIPDLQQRLDHIFHNQLYGIAITELTALASRRSLYCSKYANGKYSVSKFDNPDGNIRFVPINHTWENGKCKYCGASASQYQRADDLETHAYEFIHTNNPEEIFGMKFDVVIGNPPYHLSTTANSDGRIAAVQAQPIFQKFVVTAKKLRPSYLSMIIPARWYNGGIGLEEFREQMFNDGHLAELFDYQNSADCFSGVGIAGGICYFLWKNDYQNNNIKVINLVKGEIESSSDRNANEFGNVFIRNNLAVNIVRKVRNNSSEYLDSRVLPLNPFGFNADARGGEKSDLNKIALINSKGIGWVSEHEVKKNKQLINKYKVIIGKVVPSNGEVGIDPSKGYKAITNPKILKPSEIHTFSYMLLGSFQSEEEANNYKEYISTKFARYMLRLTYSSMNISKSNFMLVPNLNYDIKWTDELLYQKYDLSKDEIDCIENTMRPMEDK